MYGFIVVSNKVNIDVDVDDAIERSVSQNLYKHTRGNELQVIVFFRLKEFVEDDGKCKTKCQNKATCLQLPFSVKEECQCPGGYDGDFCESPSTTDFMNTLNKIFSATAQVPQLSDIYYSMEDVKEDIQNGFGAVNDSLTEMTKTLSTKLIQLSSDMQTLSKDTKFNALFTPTIRDAFNHIRGIQPIFNEFLKNRQGDDAINKAKRVLLFEKIPSWEMNLDDLLSGSRMTPYMVLLMDRNKENACSEDYKKVINSKIEEIFQLQSQLRVLHTTALHILGKDSQSNKIAEKYDNTVRKQVCWMQNYQTLNIPYYPA